jgi:hypothetical protein
MRVYCFRVGLVFDVEDGLKCPECGFSNHPEYKADNCGCYVSDIDLAHRGYGDNCVLPIGHPGKCSLNPESIAAAIHES